VIDKAAVIDQRRGDSAVIDQRLLKGGKTMPTKAEAATETILVTEQNFRTAESDKYFAQTMKRAGGIGKFLHLHELDPIDQQPYIRANRDTLLSAALFDLDAGPVTITLPETGGRFMSSIAINEEHYAVETVYAPGSFTYDKRRVGTRYVLFGIRIFADQDDSVDLEKAYLLQAAINVHQPNGPGTFKLPAWDRASQKKVRAELIRRAAALPDTKNMFGPKGKVDPERHLLGTATGWGRSAPEDPIELPAGADPNPRPGGESPGCTLRLARSAGRG
jgi:hypothetical protein